MGFEENWYTSTEVEILINLANKVKNIDGLIVEIGCWEGKSTVAIANTVYPENVICNDTWLGNVAESKCSNQKHITERILEKKDVYKIFLENMNEMTKGNYKVVKKDCLEWLFDFKNKIKFCHIDASHDYESVAHTIDLLLPNIVSGGMLCGDDFVSANISRKDLHGGVERAVREKLNNFKVNGNIWHWIND